MMTRLTHSGLDEALGRAGDGVFVIGSEGRIVMWNRSAEKILGHAAREVLGKPCCEIFVGRDEAGNRLCYQGCHVMALVRLGEPVQSFDMQTRTKAGQSVWLNISVLSVAGAGGLVVHLFRDVTAARELLRLVSHELHNGGSSNGADGNGQAGPLTRRELEVLRLVATGANTRAVAGRLHVSPATVRNHVQNIFGKLDVHSRLEAVAYASRHRLVPPGGDEPPAPSR